MEVENTIKTLKEVIEHYSGDDLKGRLLKIPSIELGDALFDLNRDELHILFSSLSEEVLIGILQTHAEEYAREVSKVKDDDELARMMAAMAPDDATDFLDFLEKPERVRDILKLCSPEVRSEIEVLLNFDEESAGGIMTSEISAFPANIRVRDVLKSIASSEHKDPLMYIYVYAPRTETFMGSVSLTSLIAADPESYVDNLIEEESVWAKADADQEDVAYIFRKHRLWVMPVVDDQHKLIGRITADDIIDVAFEEADEDIAQFTGASDLADRDTRLIDSLKMRLPWLFLTMALAFINSVVINNMMARVGQIVALAAFVPVIMAMGGNTGMQCAAIFIREIALGGMRGKQSSRIVIRETFTGFIMGLLCGGLGAVFAWFTLYTANDPALGDFSPKLVAIIVFAAIVSAMTFSSFMGSMIPILLDKVEIDPAVAAGPFVTTLNDISGTVIYFLITYALMDLYI